MSIQATPGATAPPQVAPTPAAAQAEAAASRAVAVAPAAQARPVPQVDRVRLHHPEKVDLGFRAEELRKNLQEAVNRLNDQMKSNGRDLSFSIDEKIDRTIVSVRSLKTGELVRQIPTEDMVRLAHSIEDMKGLLFNKTL